MEIAGFCGKMSHFLVDLVWIFMLLFAIFFSNFCLGDVIKKDAFKIVYVAPMKALAAEMTANFGKKLAPLGLRSKPFNFLLSQSCAIVRKYDETSTFNRSFINLLNLKGYRCY